MDIGQLLLQNLDVILIVVVGGLALFILRPVLLELARGASENIPPGAIDSIIKGITPILYSAIDGKLAELETAMRDDNRTTMDEAVVSELRGAVRELRDIIVGANTLAARDEQASSSLPK